ncbi:MAG: hypothetical protein L0Z70_04715 [Chloroflexi bacterium]|nr:hypothetical protein [Chloroflexota bacterium]
MSTFSFPKLMRLATVFLAAGALLFLTGCASGLFPQFTYQGVLTDQNGQPLDGNVDITYLIYHASSGGTAIYQETETVAVDNGLFTSVIGPSALTAGLTPDDLAKPLYLEIKVNNGTYNETLTPRQRLYGAPYAFTLMPGAVISQTFDTPGAGANGIEAVLVAKNTYSGGNIALPALKAYGVRSLELTGADSVSGPKGTLFSDVADTDSDLNMVTHDEFWIYLDSDNNSTGEFRVWNGAGASACTIQEDGDLICTGAKSAVVTVGEEQRKLYAIESPEVWFEDFGSAALVNGAAQVTIEALFAKTVNLGVDYHVFLTPLGDCKGLYVAEKTATGFTVRELGGGSANVAFDYRIVARRAGYENRRLEVAAPAEAADQP